MKITEITVTDERGEQHTLRCSEGLDIDVNEHGTLVVATHQQAHPRHVLVFPEGRYICYRLIHKD